MNNPFIPNESPQTPVCGFATVVGKTNEGVRLHLDEETEPGDKAHKKLESYAAPVEGDRVLFTRISGDIIVLGKVG